MRDKTIKGIRAASAPLFLSMASTDKDFAVSVYRDKENAVLFLASASADKAVFSPITGKKVDALSVGETASSAAELAQYKAIGKCSSKKKCGCTLYTTKALASLLVANAEKSLHCTACGAEMALDLTDVDEDIEDEAITEDDDLGEDDEDVVMEDDEDISDDDVGDEEVVDEDDEELVEDDSGDEDLDDEDVEDEVAKLIAEIASEEETEQKPAADAAPAPEKAEDEAPAPAAPVADEEDPANKPADVDTPADQAALSDVTVAHTLHALANVKSGKHRIIFIDNSTAWLTHASDDSTEMQIGTFKRDDADPESAKLFDRRDVFGKVANQLIASGALDEEQPSEDIAKLGFKSIRVSMPLTVAQAKAVKEAASAAETEAETEATARIEDVSKSFHKLVATAAVGMDKGVIGNQSFYKELSGVLRSMGAKKPDEMSRKLIETKFKPFLAAAIDMAVELSTKDAAYVAGVADSIANAQYASTDATVEEVPAISTSVHGDDSIAVASLDSYRSKPKAASNTDQIRDALRRIGRR